MQLCIVYNNDVENEQTNKQTKHQIKFQRKMIDGIGDQIVIKKLHDITILTCLKHTFEKLSNPHRYKSENSLSSFFAEIFSWFARWQMGTYNSAGQLVVAISLNFQRFKHFAWKKEIQIHIYLMAIKSPANVCDPVFSLIYKIDNWLSIHYK